MAERIYNILFLGETQSGKSTSIEFLQKYADPDYMFNQDNVGDGIFSKTAVVATTTIRTNLPSYFVTDNRQTRINYGDFLNDDHEDYEDQLNDRRSYRLEREEPPTAKVTFNLIDTPGLNDTALQDEDNIAVIFKALEAITSIHLVVITVSNNPFTEDLKSALKAYVDLLPELNGNIVFLHTKIDYSKLHPSDIVFDHSLNEKKGILHEFMGRTSVPHILIDNDIGSKRTIRNCITQNALRSLLAMAKLNQPAPIQVMIMNKTQKMRLVDDIIKDKCLSNIQAREHTLGIKNTMQKEVLAKVSELKAHISEHGMAIDNITRDLAFHDVNLLVLHHETLYQQDFSFKKMVTEGPQTMYFPGKQRAAAPGFIHHVFDHMDVQAHNIKVLQEVGGKDHTFWATRFRRKRRQNGTYHARIYITKKKKHTVEIEGWKTAANRHRELLSEYEAELTGLDQQEQQLQSEIEELLEHLKEDRYLLARASVTRLDNTIFQLLVKSGGYVRDLGDSAVNVERFYFERRADLENMESKFNYHVPQAFSTSEETNDVGGDDVTPTSPDDCVQIALTEAIDDLAIKEDDSMNMEIEP